MLRRYPNVGEPLACEPITKGLLNHGYRVSTTRGSYFLKHHLDKKHIDDATGERATIVRQHRATQRLASLGVPVVPPLTDAEGTTVTVIGDRCYALHPWVDGLHRVGSQLTPTSPGVSGRSSEPYTPLLSRSCRRTVNPSRPTGPYRPVTAVRTPPTPSR